MRVMVAMSGGVDSAVSALLLKNQGFEVEGATFLLGEGEAGLAAVEDAKKVADFLGVPHRVFDFRELFAEKVLGDFLSEYGAGRTPNPCVRCNRYIKFPAFLAEAEKLGCEKIATGHYARVAEGKLFRATALEKDQSYVLYSLTRELISHIIFPLGELAKTEVRQIAAEAGIPAAKKPDSEDICFIPDGDTGGFLARHGCGSEPGDFVARDGAVLGRHKGVAHYTIGQRKGLGLALPEPLYVGSIDPESRNILLVKNGELFVRELLAGAFHWISGLAPEGKISVQCKIRYAHKPAEALAEALPDGTVRVGFLAPQRAVTRGQSAVLYRGDEVLGGGVIL